MQRVLANEMNTNTSSFLSNRRESSVPPTKSSSTGGERNIGGAPTPVMQPTPFTLPPLSMMTASPTGLVGGQANHTPTSTQTPVTILPQFPLSGGGAYMPPPPLPHFPGSGGGAMGGSTLAIVNGVPLVIDVSKLLELVQMGASLALVPSTELAAAVPPTLVSAPTLHKRTPPSSSPTLDSEDQDGMERKGPEPSLREDLWTSRMNELRAFRERFGHVDVRRAGSRWEPLARWLDDLRQQWGRHEEYFPSSKAAELRQLGVQPIQDDSTTESNNRDRKRNGLSDEDRWDVRIQQIREFKRVHGHLKIPKNSQSALYYWAYGAKKKWRKYKDKRQRDLVEVGLISEEDYQREWRSKQGSQSVQSSPFPASSSASLTASHRQIEQTPRPSALPEQRRTHNANSQPRQVDAEVKREDAASNRGGLLRLGLIGEEEYERELVADGRPTRIPAVPAPSFGSSIIIPNPLRPQPRTNSEPVLSPTHLLAVQGTSEQVDSGVERKLKDLLALGLLSQEEFNRQVDSSPPPNTSTSQLRQGEDAVKQLTHSSDGSRSRQRESKQDDNNDKGMPDGSDEDETVESYPRSAKDEQRWKQRVEQMRRFAQKHGHFNVPRSMNSQLYYWAYGAKRKWREWGLDKQKDLVNLGLISREEFEAYTGKKWDNVETENARGSPSKRRRLTETEETQNEREEDEPRTEDDSSIVSSDDEEREPLTPPEGCLASAKPTRKRNRLRDSSSPSRHSRRNTSEEGLEEYRKRAFGGTDEEYAFACLRTSDLTDERLARRWALRIRELKSLEEHEGTWCVPRKWSKSLKRWLEYSINLFFQCHRHRRTLTRVTSVKLRWRSGRLTEKQINDLTAIGIIKDDRFYGIRDKRELDRELLKGSNDGGNDSSSNLSSGEGNPDSESSSDEESYQFDKEDDSSSPESFKSSNSTQLQWQNRSVSSAPESSDVQDSGDWRSPSTISGNSQFLCARDNLRKAILAEDKASDGGADRHASQQRIENERRPLDADVEMIRLMWLRESERQRANILREKIEQTERERQQLLRQEEGIRPSLAPSHAQLDNDEDGALEIADDTHEEEELNQRSPTGEGEEGESHETGILYEVETEEEWKKLTKEQRRQRRMAQLHQFYAEFGHGNVQHQWPKNKRLANWVYEQKQRWRKGLLTDAEVREFEALKMRKPRPGFGRPPKRRKTEGEGSQEPTNHGSISAEDSQGSPHRKRSQKRARSKSGSSGNEAHQTTSTSPSLSPQALPISSASTLLPQQPLHPVLLPQALAAGSLPGLPGGIPAASILSYLAPLNHLLPPLLFPSATQAAGNLQPMAPSNTPPRTDHSVLRPRP